MEYWVGYIRSISLITVFVRTFIRNTELLINIIFNERRKIGEKAISTVLVNQILIPNDNEKFYIISVFVTCSSAFWPRDNLFVEKIIDHDRRIVERAFDGIIIPDIQ